MHRNSNTQEIWNYLRVRGEYRQARNARIDYVELPPRARRIQGWENLKTGAGGTTSACAENTFF